MNQCAGRLWKAPDSHRVIGMGCGRPLPVRFESTPAHLMENEERTEP